MSEKVVIVAAGRTAIGTFGGSLASVPAHILGATVISGVLDQAGLKPEQVDEVKQQARVKIRQGKLPLLRGFRKLFLA